MNHVDEYAGHAETLLKDSESAAGGREERMELLTRALVYALLAIASATDNVAISNGFSDHHGNV